MENFYTKGSLLFDGMDLPKGTLMKINGLFFLLLEPYLIHAKETLVLQATNTKIFLLDQPIKTIGLSDKRHTTFYTLSDISLCYLPKDF